MKNKDAKVISVGIQKGGCGKSLVSLNLAYALGKQGYNVLLIDMDPQATTSLLLNIDITNNEVQGIQNLIEQRIEFLKGNISFEVEDIKECIIRPTYFKTVREKNNYVSKECEFGFDLIPSRIELANYDIELNQLEIGGRRVGGFVLKSIIDKIKSEMDYDFIILDVLPGLNMLAYSAIAASYNGGVIMPINMDKTAINGGENLLNVVTDIQTLFYWKDNERTEIKKNPIIHKGILGVVKNKYKPNLKISQTIDENLYNYFGPAHIFKTSIPSSTNCDKAHSEGRLYAEYFKTAGEAFNNLATEVVQEIERREDETEPHLILKFGKEYLEEGGE